MVELEAKFDDCRSLMLLGEQRKRRIEVVTGMTGPDSPERMGSHSPKRVSREHW